MKLALLSINRPPLKPLIISGLIVGIAVGVSFYPKAGFDWYVYFSQTAFRSYSDASVYYPAWIYLIIRPLTYLPNAFLWYTLLNATFLIIAVQITEHPSWGLVFTLPVFWILFYGQIDAWMVLGVALAQWSLKNHRPVWMGLALLLLSTKPHLGLPLALYYILNLRDIKILIVPMLVLVTSTFTEGFWPIIFLQHAFSLNVQQFAQQAVNVNLSGWPYTLALVPLIILAWKQIPESQRPLVIFAATCIIVPYCPVYSLAPLFLFNIGWLALVLFPAWFGPTQAITWGLLFGLLCVLYLLSQVLFKSLAPLLPRKEQEKPL